MKKLLMSFWPSVYDRIVAQDKLIEFRRRYPNETTVVYMYVSKPCMAIKGIVLLGRRVDMSKVSVKSDFYAQAIKDGYHIEKYTYGMPIHSVKVTEPLTLAYLKSVIPKFTAPQSYYDLDNNPDLLHIIESNIKPTTKYIYNNIVFPEVFDDKII